MKDFWTEVEVEGLLPGVVDPRSPVQLPEHVGDGLVPQVLVQIGDGQVLVPVTA